MVLSHQEADTCLNKIVCHDFMKHDGVARVLYDIVVFTAVALKDDDIAALRDAIVSSPVRVALHRANVFTRVFQETEGEPWALRRAWPPWRAVDCRSR